MAWIELAVSLAALAIAPTAGAYEVAKQEDPTYHETIYQVTAPHCVIAWEVQRFADEPGFGISESSKCDLPVAQQVAVRDSILDRVMKDTNGFQGVRNFAWGALRRGDANDEYATRFTAVIGKLPQWDKRNGKLIGDAAKRHHFLPDVINKEGVFHEVADEFSARGFTLHAADVETVIVENISGQKLPVDCTVLFNVIRSTPANK